MDRQHQRKRPGPLVRRWTERLLAGLCPRPARHRLRRRAAADRYTIGTAGSFDKIMLNAVRLQHLGDRLQLFAQLNAQWSGGNLDSAEQFDMGGPYGVRAFPRAATRATATKAGKPVRSCATAWLRAGS